MTKISTDFSILVDKELTLKIPSVEDTEELFRLVDKNRKHLREFLGWLDYSTQEYETRKFIEEGLPLWLNLKSLHLHIMKRNKIIGAVGLHNIDFMNHSTALGYWLDEEHQGQGIMKKSADALINYVFNDLRFHRIELLCAVHNKSSEKLALALGFQKEGTLKEAIFNYGSYFDANLYALIKSQL